MEIVAGRSNRKIARSIANKLGIELVQALVTEFRPFSELATDIEWNLEIQNLSTSDINSSKQKQTESEAEFQNRPNQEIKVQIPTQLSHNKVVIVQSTYNLIELLMISDIVSSMGVSEIIAVIPYFSYARQDKPYVRGECSSLDLIIKLLSALGVKKIITVDIHSRTSFTKYGVELINITIHDLIANHLLSNYALSNITLISPDYGGINTVQCIAKKLNTKFVIMQKHKTLGEYNITLQDDISGSDCIIIDDIVDCGTTLTKASSTLIKNGAKSVSAYITHGVFSGNIRQILTSINKLYLTNTIELCCEFSDNRIEILNIDNSIIDVLSTLM